MTYTIVLLPVPYKLSKIMTTYSATVFTFIFSQTAWIILITVSKWSLMNNPGVILLVGIFFLSLLFSTLVHFLPQPTKKNFYENKSIRLIYYMSSLWAWSCMVDLVIYLETLDVIHGVMKFYLDHGEPYLGASFGKAANIWDATVHFALYLSMIYHIQNGNTKFRQYGLFWCGTMITGMLCLIPGTFTGEWGKEIHLAIVLNSPYFILPFWCLHYFLIGYKKDVKMHR